MRHKKIIKSFLQDNAIMIDGLMSKDEQKALGGKSISNILIKDIEKQMNSCNEVRPKRIEEAINDFNVLEFIANNAGLSLDKALTKAYELGLKRGCEEKERIIKDLEDEVNYWKDRHFNQNVSDEKARSYQHAIEIVKRGDK